MDSTLPILFCVWVKSFISLIFNSKTKRKKQQKNKERKKRKKNNNSQNKQKQLPSTHHFKTFIFLSVCLTTGGHFLEKTEINKHENNEYIQAGRYFLIAEKRKKIASVKNIV